MNIITQFFKKNYSGVNGRFEEIKRDLLRRESKIGGQLFGPVPKGVTREFFCLDRHTWVWVEQWNQGGSYKSRTTKYMIRSTEILKSVNGSSYERVSVQEAKNFEKAVNQYVKRVKSEIYGIPAAA